MSSGFTKLSTERQRRIDRVCREFEESRYVESPPPLTSFVNHLPNEDRDDTLRELFAIDFELHLANEQPISLEMYLRDWPDDTVLIKEVYSEVIGETRAQASPKNGSAEPRRLGGYRIVGEIGRGGMGLVYEAIDESLHRRVALKVLQSHLWFGAGEQRFQREARAIARLHHSHIVDVYGNGEQDGVAYFAMQFIDGASLDHLIRQASKRDSKDASAQATTVVSIERPSSIPSDQTRSLDFLSQTDLPLSSAITNSTGTTHALIESTRNSQLVCDLVDDNRRIQFAVGLGAKIGQALQYAHEKGVLHRDVKPANILIDSQGTPWLTDFGLAKLDSGDHDGALTAQGDVIGTLRYMAPEIFRYATDARSDVFSLGLTLLELIALKPAFGTINRDELLAKRLRGESPLLEMLDGRVPRDLATVIKKATETEPASRYQTAGEFASDLQRVLDDEPIHARQVSLMERFWRWARRNKALAGALLTITTMLVLGLVLSLGAAAYFRHLGSQQRTLAQEKGELASKNANLASEAQAERDRATLIVSDVYTERGLEATDQYRHREALLWFAHAAAKSESLDSDRLQKSLLRYRRLSRDMTRPVALLENDVMVDRLMIHPSRQYIMIRPFLGSLPKMWNIATQQQVELPESQASASALAWSPSGRWLAVGGQSQVTLLPFPECVESPDSRIAVKQVIPAAGNVHRVEFDASGRFLALAGDKFARVWDLEAEDFVYPLLTPDHIVAGLVFSPDSHHLLTFGRDRFQVFELGKSGRAAWANAEAIVSGMHHYFRSWSYLTPRFIRQGKGILTCPSSSSVQVWNLESRQPEPPFIVDAAGLMYCVESLPNDEVFVGGTKGSTILSTANPNEIRPQNLPTTTNAACMAAAYDALRHELFIGYGNRPNERWLLQEKHQQPCFSTSPNGCLTAAFSPDGRMLAVVNYDWDIFVWENPEKSTDDFTVSLDSSAHHADFSADSRYVAVTSFETAACVYDLRTKERLATLPKPADSDQLLQPLFLSNPDLLAVVVRIANEQRRIDIWNWRTGERRQSFDYPKEKSEYDFRSEVRPSADRRRLLAPSDNGVAFVLDVNSAGELITQRIHNPMVKEWHEISPDGRLLAATTMKNKNLSIGLLYEIANNSAIAELSHDYRVPRWRFSKDSSQLATASWDNSVRIWESNTGKLISGPLPHSSPVYDAEFSRDNQHLLTYAKDATALVWDLRSGRPATAPYSGEEEVVAAFRPGHDQAIVMDAKGSFNVWDWRNSTRLWPTAQLSATQGQFWTLARTVKISSDGRFAAVGGISAMRLIDLTALDDRDQITDHKSTNNFLREAELFSGHRLLDNGGIAKLTTLDWQQRIWHSELASNQRQQHGDNRNFASQEKVETWKPSTESTVEELARQLEATSDSASQVLIALRAARSWEVLTKLTERLPAVPSLHVLLARHLAERNEMDAALNHRRRAIDLFEKRLAADPHDSVTADQLADLFLEIHSPRWHTLRTTELKSELGATLTAQGDESILASGKNEDGDTYSITATSSLDRITALRLEVIPDRSLPSGGSGRHLTGNFQLEKIRLSRQSGINELLPIPLTSAMASYQYEASDIDIAAIFRDRPGIEKKVWHVATKTSSPHYALFAAEPTKLESQQPLVVTLSHYKFQIPTETVNLGRFRLSVTNADKPFDWEPIRLAFMNHTLPPLDALKAIYRVLGEPQKAEPFENR